jgi:hypothetical protein
MLKTDRSDTFFHRIYYSNRIWFDAMVLKLRSRYGFNAMLMAFRVLISVIFAVLYFRSTKTDAFGIDPLNNIVGLIYLLSVILMSVGFYKKPTWLDKPWSHIFIIILDILVINYYIWLGRNDPSEIYLLLLVPLVTAAHFFKRSMSVAISFVILASYLFTEILISVGKPDIVLLAGRSIFLVASAWLYRIQRNLPGALDDEIMSPSKARTRLEEMLSELIYYIPYTTISVQILYRGQLQIVACRGFDNPDEIYRIEFPVADENYPNFEVIFQKRSLILDPANYSSFKENQFFAGHIKSWLGVPLISPSTQECFGMISIDSSRPNAFDRKTIRHADWFATNVSRFITEVTLGPAALSLTTRRITLQNSLKMWAELLPRKTSLWEDDLQAAQDIVHIGQKIFHVEDCSISFLRHRYDPQLSKKERVLHLVASSTIPSNIFEQHESLVTGKHGDGLTGMVIHRNRSLNYGAAETQKSPYRGTFTSHLEFLHSKCSKQILIVPLRDSTGQPTGAIKLENKLGLPSQSAFLLVEESLFEVFAAMVSLMLENIRQRNYITRQQQSVHNVRAILYPTAIKPIETLLESSDEQEILVEASLLKEIRTSVNYTKSVLDGILSDSIETLILENEGLIPAIRQYIEALKNIPPLNEACERISLHGNEVRDELPFRVRVSFYNIAREAILNMVRYSKIEEKLTGIGTITLVRQGEGIHLTIEDNGAGFMVARTKEQSRSFGLRDMDMQVAAIKKLGLDSLLEINSELGAGTHIHVWAATKKKAGKR